MSTSTTLTQQFERTAMIVRLWKALLPEVPPPTDEFVARWAFNYTDDVIMLGLKRASRKSRKAKAEGHPFTTEEVHRYATGTMSSETFKQQSADVLIPRSTEPTATAMVQKVRGNE